MSGCFSQPFTGRSPRWEQISLFMGDVTPKEEVSEQDKHKDKSPSRYLIFIRDEQPAGEGFLSAPNAPPPLFFYPDLISNSCTEMVVMRCHTRGN